MKKLFVFRRNKLERLPLAVLLFSLPTLAIAQLLAAQLLAAQPVAAQPPGGGYRGGGPELQDMRDGPMEVIDLPEPVVSITIEGDQRVMRANGLPNHPIGKFPNKDNPNAIRPREAVYKIPANPKIAERPSPAMPEFWFLHLTESCLTRALASFGRPTVTAMAVVLPAWAAVLVVPKVVEVLVDHAAAAVLLVAVLPVAVLLVAVLLVDRAAPMALGTTMRWRAEHVSGSIITTPTFSPPASITTTACPPV